MTDTRRRRHLDELCALCARGQVARAIDLAFEHFADEGRDGATVEILRAAIAERGVITVEVRNRLAELEGGDE